jgi:hypothetical protein
VTIYISVVDKRLHAIYSPPCIEMRLSNILHVSGVTDDVDIFRCRTFCEAWLLSAPATVSHCFEFQNHMWNSKELVVEVQLKFIKRILFSLMF